MSFLCECAGGRFGGAEISINKAGIRHGINLFHQSLFIELLIRDS